MTPRNAQKHAFPVEELKPTSGSIHALLFENPYAQVMRQLFWNLEVSFAPIILGSGSEEAEEFDCSAACEWLELGVQDWRKLAGVAVRGGEEVEASFYVVEHARAVKTDIRFGPRLGAEFELHWEMLVDYQGYWGDDEDPTLPITMELRVPFEGLMVHFDIVKPESKNESLAVEAVTPFVDLAAFGPPRLQTNEFGIAAFWFPPLQ